MKNSKKLAGLGEFGWIASLQKKYHPKHPHVVGIGDDTAVLPGTKKDILLTTDMIIEGRHFTRQQATAYEIGRKALAVNISDIAAMAGVPKYAVVAVGLPGSLEVSYVDEIARGVKELAKRFKIEVVGGDTNQSDKIVISVTLMGEAQKGKAVYRSGAKKGDWIFVSGALGGSYASRKHLNFMPRVDLALKLSKLIHLHAMMDISDGLLSDLSHICKASQAGAVLFAPQIPLSDRVSLHQALTEGEDFELLFTVSDKEARKILASPSLSAQVYPVGRMAGSRPEIQLLDGKGLPIRFKKKGFDHFKK